MSELNRKIVLASRPETDVTADNFRLAENPVPEPGEGQVLARTLWLSLDPYMRGRMSGAASYAAPVEIGGVMSGEVVARVVRSRAAAVAEGDLVLARSGWQDWAVLDADAVRPLPETLRQTGAPVQTALGVLGMPGMTAWVGLHNIGQPKPGETVVVAAASGPVGSMVGQLARIRGARAVGITGGAQKCAYVRDALGFEACLDHRAPDLARQLEAACPGGIDVYWENVGGAVREAVWPLLNAFARVPVCGLVADYIERQAPGPDRIAPLFRAALTKRLRIQGFLVYDFAAQESAFLHEVAGLIRDGRIHYREDVTDGLEHAPAAFMAMLSGGNLGKTLVRVAD